MKPTCIDSPKLLEHRATAVPGALVRHGGVPGFCQARLSQATVLLIGAGGLNGPVAVTLARKGVGGITIIDPDFVEVSNLNRQRFFPTDVGRSKALVLAQNLLPECTAATRLLAHSRSFEEIVAGRVRLPCDVAVCGVDNNPARVAASRYFRAARVPVIFSAVSGDADHGYVFVQDRSGACLGCLFPDIVGDQRYPCPGTPAVADVLQTLAGVSAYAIDTCLMDRRRDWNYRTVSLARGWTSGAATLPMRSGCTLVMTHS